MRHSIALLNPLIILSEFEFAMAPLQRDQHEPVAIVGMGK